MNNHPIDDLTSGVLENLKKMVDANTAIGEPIILPNGVSIIPVTRLSCGFACGGSEFVQKSDTSKMPFGGATGGGISLQPLGFICVTADGNTIEFVTMDGSDSIDAFIEGATKIVQSIKWPKRKSKNEVAADEVIADMSENNR